MLRSLASLTAPPRIPPRPRLCEDCAFPTLQPINAATPAIDERRYLDALDKLENDIIAKTDGCANAGAPDKNDCITSCAAQGQVYPFMIEAINLLKLL